MATSTRSKQAKASASSTASSELGSAQAAESAVACNLALIVGELVTEPELRTLPAGTKILSFSLTVRQPGERTTSVPLTWFDPPKRTSSWKVGTQLVACGPVVRRFYQYAGGTGSRTEVQVEHADVVTRRSVAKKLIGGVGDRVAATLEAAGR